MTNPLSDASRPPIQMAARATSEGRNRPRKMDETEYLMGSPTNAQRLRDAIDEFNTTGVRLENYLNEQYVFCSRMGRLLILARERSKKSK